MCVTWNKAVRKMYSLPYSTHRWILGPLTNQRHIKYQLFARQNKLFHSSVVLDKTEHGFGSEYAFIYSDNLVIISLSGNT